MDGHEIVKVGGDVRFKHLKVDFVHVDLYIGQSIDSTEHQHYHCNLSQNKRLNVL